MILAGDIGGTKCNLAAFEEDGAKLRLVFQRRYATLEFPDFAEVIDQFRRDVTNAKSFAGGDFMAAGFGVPGVVVAGEQHTINMPWPFDHLQIAAKLNLSPAHIAVVNDLVATAWAILKLPPSEFLVLNKGATQLDGNKAVIAAGTGLGEAILFWDGQQHRVSPSEGSVADFAPRNDREIELFRYMKKSIPHVYCEEILSGRGFRWIHESLNPSMRHATFSQPPAESAHEITRFALEKSCAVCVETLNLWTEMYGAEAGNIAVRVLAYGGVYIAGGIALKILPKMKDGSFVRAFCDKAKLSTVLARIPISIVLNEDAPLWGAAYQALSLARGA